MGVIKAASQIQVDWVRHLIPLLKDPIDVAKLSGKSKPKIETMIKTELS